MALEQYRLTITRATNGWVVMTHNGYGETADDALVVPEGGNLGDMIAAAIASKRLGGQTAPPPLQRTIAEAQMAAMNQYSAAMNQYSAAIPSNGVAINRSNGAGGGGSNGGSGFFGKLFGR